jgi:hypothetical protein
MRNAAILLASVLGMAAAGCSAGAHEGQGGGATARRNFPVGAFQSVSLTGSPDVIVTVGGQPSVRAEGDARLVERLEIVVENGDLKIRMRDSSGWHFGFSHDRGVTVHVTVPALAAATLTGSGDIRIDRVQGERFAGTVTGSGDLAVQQMRANEAAFTVTGSGGITAAGAAQRTNIQLTGSGDIRLGALETRNTTVSLQGSGDVAAKAMDTAEVHLMGSGDVAISGTARCSIDKRGSGDVRCTG